ncbi:MAG: trigger factor [Oligosphaeraceae bacterium]|nr:trigger factor [Oligosphaeraceae bacterium]
MEFTASDLQIVRTDPAPCVVSLSVSIPADKAMEVYRQTFNKYTERVRLPGFRPGKVPAHIIEKRFGQDIRTETGEALFSKTCDEALKAEKIKPGIEMKQQDLELGEFQVEQEYSYKVRIETEPAFELPEYVGVSVSSNEVKVGEEEVNAIIDQLLEQYSTYNAVQRGAQRNDMLKLSYSCTAPEELINNDKITYFLKAENTWLLMKEPELLPGAITVLEGMSAGEKKEAEISFPEEHHSEELRGQTFTYTFDVSEVQEQTPPEMNEEFCKKLGVENVEELKERIEENVRRSKQNSEDQKAVNQIMDALVAGQTFDMPPTLVAAAKQDMLNAYAQRQENRNLDEKELNAKLAAYDSEAEQQVLRALRLEYILDEIARKENLKPEGQELINMIQNYATQNRKSMDEALREMRKSGEIGYIYRRMQKGRIVDFLLEKANRNIISAED